MLRVSELEFSYPGQRFQLVLPSLEVRAGEPVAITGPSGCGKSTLLRLCAGILSPSAGRIELGGFPVATAEDDARREFRLRRVGLVFQEFALLPYLTVAQNILAPLRLIPGARVDEAAQARLHELAAATGLDSVLHQLPEQLSGGEKQRTGLCRALIHQPAFLFADEPTSNLDAASQQRSLDALLNQARRSGACVLVVSHARETLDRFNRVEHLPDLLRPSP